MYVSSTLWICWVPSNNKSVFCWALLTPQIQFAEHFWSEWRKKRWDNKGSMKNHEYEFAWTFCTCAISASPRWNIVVFGRVRIGGKFMGSNWHTRDTPIVDMNISAGGSSRALLGAKYQWICEVGMRRRSQCPPDFLPLRSPVFLDQNAFDADGEKLSTASSHFLRQTLHTSTQRRNRP